MSGITDLEKLYLKIFKDTDYMYVVSRYVDRGKFKVKDNMSDLGADEFVGYIYQPKNLKQRLVIKYSCPIVKTFNGKGKLLRKELLIDQGKWSKIPRKKFLEEAKQYHVRRR